MREGVSLHYDTYGDGATTVLLVPAWSIVHSRIWKAQVAFLARPAAATTLRGDAPGSQPGVGAANGNRPPPLGSAWDHTLCAMVNDVGVCEHRAPAIETRQLPDHLRKRVTAMYWGSSGRRFKSCQPDTVSQTLHLPPQLKRGV